ncbi:Cysteine-rich receptor-like kinase [Rhynchospora pubera]|uniref:Cysteine-rich receptor-like kinase n=1 Tax=Rhynchospora pubera TaxID=906938 RepID=A0AAV8F5P0_9POAL|nr:Cysteine-rich receptor-like kinase [Rhynchospora pubera]
MLSASLSVALLFPHLVLTLLQLQPSAGNFVSSICSPTDKYTNGSTFEFNLVHLIDYLYRDATTNGGFSTLSSGNWPDEAYGLIMCYDEYTVEDCISCLRNTTSLEASEICPRSKTAVIYYDQCFLRYSDKNFFSQVNSHDHYCSYDTISPPIDDASMKFVINFISNLSAEASQKPRMAALKMMVKGTISASVQCTRDLTPQGCRKCLQRAIDNDDFSRCSGNMNAAGMRLLYGSCYIKYETSWNLISINNSFQPKQYLTAGRVSSGWLYSTIQWTSFDPSRPI